LAPQTTLGKPASKREKEKLKAPASKETPEPKR
jgi:hypothetical protein